MDRLYVMQKSYVNDRGNPDGLLIKNLLNYYKTRNLDETTEVESFEEFAASCANEKHLKIIPVGTIEFVKDGLEFIAGEPVYMKPVEVPATLQENRWLNRSYRMMKGKEIQSILSDAVLPKRYFIKDADHLKRWNNLLIDGDCTDEIEPETNYVISDYVSFLAEYRVFVYRDKAVGIQNYLGNPLIFPSTRTLNEMLYAYASLPNHPGSYTMDVGIIKDASYALKTSIIEIHPFAACGLYGFYDKVVPDMLEDGINWYLSEEKRRNKETSICL